MKKKVNFHIVFLLIGIRAGISSRRPSLRISECLNRDRHWPRCRTGLRSRFRETRLRTDGGREKPTLGEGRDAKLTGNGREYKRWPVREALTRVSSTRRRLVSPRSRALFPLFFLSSRCPFFLSLYLSLLFFLLLGSTTRVIPFHPARRDAWAPPRRSWIVRWLARINSIPPRISNSIIWTWRVGEEQAGECKCDKWVRGWCYKKERRNKEYRDFRLRRMTDPATAAVINRFVDGTNWWRRWWWWLCSASSSALRIWQMIVSREAN